MFRWDDYLSLGYVSQFYLIGRGIINNPKIGEVCYLTREEYGVYSEDEFFVWNGKYWVGFLGVLREINPNFYTRHMDIDPDVVTDYLKSRKSSYYKKKSEVRIDKERLRIIKDRKKAAEIREEKYRKREEEKRLKRELRAKEREEKQKTLLRNRIFSNRLLNTDTRLRLVSLLNQTLNIGLVKKELYKHLKIEQDKQRLKRLEEDRIKRLDNIEELEEELRIIFSDNFISKKLQQEKPKNKSNNLKKYIKEREEQEKKFQIRKAKEKKGINGLRQHICKICGCLTFRCKPLAYRIRNYDYEIPISFVCPECLENEIKILGKDKSLFDDVFIDMYGWGELSDVLYFLNAN